MKGSRLVVLVAVLGITAFPATSATARQRQVLGESAAIEGSAVVGNLDPGLFDYLRSWSNGIAEYGLAADPGLTPKADPYSPPQPPQILAARFLDLNQGLLGIARPGDLRWISTDRRCDGTDLAHFEQTYAGYRVETSYVDVLVQGQVVKYVSARIVLDVLSLPLCQPQGDTSKIKSIAFVPRIDGFVVVATEEQIARSGCCVSYRDLCTRLLIGTTVSYK